MTETPSNGSNLKEMIHSYLYVDTGNTTAMLYFHTHGNLTLNLPLEAAGLLTLLSVSPVVFISGLYIMAQ